MKRPVITLTTDFGAGGPYVAAMKGVILSINSEVELVDVSHEIAPQNIREAALCLAQVAPYFPGGTIHVVVVDPGVGTARRLLGVSMREQLFLAPDNGVLSWSARGADQVEPFELSEPNFWLDPVSATFHGRDILAPVAAHLSLGRRLSELGRRVRDWMEIPWPSAARGAGSVVGEVLAIDHFGNLLTNITTSDLAAADWSAVRVWCVGQDIGPLVRTYADARAGELLALIGSSDLLEIAVRNGSAAARLGVAVGARVEVLSL